MSSDMDYNLNKFNLINRQEKPHKGACIKILNLFYINYHEGKY
jgi:hypothetical protein